jgi:hypothetical protein
VTQRPTTVRLTKEVVRIRSHQEDAEVEDTVEEVADATGPETEQTTPEAERK